MAWRIHESVVRGEIDNCTPASVKGRIWLVDRSDPLVLQLTGNCHKDLAGCLLTFSNPEPHPDPSLGLAGDQTGVTGDMTAARKVRVIEGCDIENWKTEKPSSFANALYLEWYSDKNGRVVIESTNYEIAVSEPSWKMSSEDEARQHEASAEAMQTFLDRVAGALNPREEAAYAKGPENEFEWELFLRASDRRVEKLGEVIEKYHTHPDRDRLIARAMGWSHIEEMLDAQAEFEKEDGPATDDEDNSATDIEPDELDTDDWNPARHPLVVRVRDRSIELHKLVGETRDKDLCDMQAGLMVLGGKLAGALGSLTRGLCDEEWMKWLVVAKLKRAIGELSRALNGANRLKERNVPLSFSIDEWITEMFEIRQEILALMDHYRR
jgi:hypothetical protein